MVFRTYKLYFARYTTTPDLWTSKEPNWGTQATDRYETYIDVIHMTSHEHKPVGPMKTTLKDDVWHHLIMITIPQKKIYWDLQNRNLQTSQLHKNTLMDTPLLPPIPFHRGGNWIVNYFIQRRVTWRCLGNKSQTNNWITLTDWKLGRWNSFKKLQMRKL